MALSQYTRMVAPCVLLQRSGSTRRHKYVQKSKSLNAYPMLEQRETTGRTRKSPRKLKLDAVLFDAFSRCLYIPRMRMFQCASEEVGC
jgi:hypothetical protein